MGYKVNLISMKPISEKEVREQEERAAYLKGDKARKMREEVESTLARAEASNISPDLLDRLDVLLINLTEASRDVCTNTKCPHYNKKCKMR